MLLIPYFCFLVKRRYLVNHPMQICSESRKVNSLNVTRIYH